MPTKSGKIEKSAGNVPRHVAIIMDGNGRWARRRLLPRHDGHTEGAESVRAVTRECARLGVQQLTLYAFSTENWRRPGREIRFLMGLLERFLVSERDELMRNNIRVRAIGRLEMLPERVRATLEETQALCAANSGMILRLALSYGGRLEILDAARKLAIECRDKGLDLNSLEEKDLVRHLYDPEMGDPDLLIRTGGEMRLSNFLLWQLSYAELHFTATCWPEFRASHLRQAFQAYARRERRFGGLLPAKGASASVAPSR